MFALEKIGEVAEAFEVGQGRSSPVHIPESVMEEMAWEESCMHNPDQEVRPILCLDLQTICGDPYS